MTSFRYRDKGTLVHRLNPLSKITWALSVLVLTLVLDNPVFLLAVFLSTLPVVQAARVWGEWRATMKYTVMLCAVVVLINALVSSNGSHVMATAPFSIPLTGTPVITLEAIAYGAAMALRLIAIISAFAILTFTVNPDDMMLAMLKMKLPYKSVLVTSLSTRFIPTLIDDTKRITDAHRSRGVRLDTGSLKQRIRSRSLIVIALLSNSLDRSVQVAEAMESRAFGSGDSRSYYKDIRLTVTDVFTVVFAILPGALGIFMGVSGYGQFQYYPTLGQLGLNVTERYLLMLAEVLLLSILPLVGIKRRRDID